MATTMSTPAFRAAICSLAGTWGEGMRGVRGVSAPHPADEEECGDPRAGQLCLEQPELAVGLVGQLPCGEGGEEGEEEERGPRGDLSSRDPKCAKRCHLWVLTRRIGHLSSPMEEEEEQRRGEEVHTWRAL